MGTFTVTSSLAYLIPLLELNLRIYDEDLGC